MTEREAQQPLRVVRGVLPVVGTVLAVSVSSFSTVASTFQFCPDVAALTADSPAPVQADAQGRYPAPVPGAWTEI